MHELWFWWAYSACWCVSLVTLYDIGEELLKHIQTKASEALIHHCLSSASSLFSSISFAPTFSHSYSFIILHLFVCVFFPGEAVCS